MSCRLARRLLLAALVLLAPCACTKKEIVFDSSEPLSLTPGIQWAVVTSPYAAFFEEADYASAVLTYSRAGAVLRVMGSARTRNPDSEKKDGRMSWYRFEQGWLPQPSVTIFDNKLRAQSFARKLQR